MPKGKSIADIFNQRDRINRYLYSRRNPTNGFLSITDAKRGDKVHETAFRYIDNIHQYARKMVNENGGIYTRKYPQSVYMGISAKGQNAG